MNIKISGEILEVRKVRAGRYLPLLVCGKCEYYVAEDSESAGDAAAKYWEDMAKDDPEEFVAIIGESRLVDWALGRGDEYGISSLAAFLEVTATVPEEQWASYDMEELEVEEIEEPKAIKWIGDTIPIEQEYEDKKAEYDGWRDVVDALGFTPTVAYRHN